MKITKKFFAIIVVLSMIITCLPTGIVYGEQEKGSAQKPADAIAWDSATSLPANDASSKGKYYYLTKDVTISETQQYGSNASKLTIDLNGFNITSTGLNSNTTVLIVNGTCDLTITDTSSGEQGRLIGTSKATTAYYVVRIFGSKGATLNFDGGQILGSDNNSDYLRTALYLDGATGTAGQIPILNMSGGKISGIELVPSGRNGAAITTDATGNYDGIKKGMAKINISGGEISNNSATASAAVYGRSTDINISGGLFCGNVSGTNGGAVRADYGSSLTISGGTFTGNSAASAGGAVFTPGKSTSNENLLGVNATISGGTFTENSAPQAGGIIVQGVLTLSGNPVIKNNTSTKDRANLYIGAVDGKSAASVVTDGLTEGAEIYVSVIDSKIPQEGALSQIIGMSEDGDERYIHSEDDSVLVSNINNTIFFCKPSEDAIIYKSVAYEPWSSTSTLPTGGAYYLTDNVDIAQAIQYAQLTNTAINLNGHNITSASVNSNTGVFIVAGSGRLSVTDSNSDNQGRLIGPSTQKYVIQIFGTKDAATRARFKMDGGQILGSDNNCASLQTAIYMTSGNEVAGSYPYLNISGGTFEGLKTEGYSGAVINTGSYGNTIKISGGLFTGNKAIAKFNNNVQSGGYGGVIRAGKANGTSLDITGGTFTHNESYSGGAIFTTGGQGINLSDAVITDNTANVGGAVLCQGILALSGSPIVKNNTAETYDNIYVTKFDGTSNASFVTNGLKNGADVYISVADTSAESTTITEEGMVITPTATAGDEKYIHSDNAGVHTEYVEGEGLRFYKLGDITGTIDMANVVIGADLTMNFYAVYSSRIADKVQLIVTLAEDEPVILDGSFLDNGHYYNHYKFAFEGITSQRMNDVIDAELIYKNGDEELVLDTIEDFSIVEYVDELHTKLADDEALCKLLADMLTFGAESQRYTHYNKKNPADALAWVSAAKTGTYEGAAKDAYSIDESKSAKGSFAKQTLHIDRYNCIAAYIESDDPTGLSVKTYAGGVLVDSKNVADLAAVGKDGEYYGYYTPSIYPTGHDDVYTIQLLEGADVIQTLTYSVNSYIYAKQDVENEAQNIVRALYNYGASADAYMASKMHDLTKTEFHVGPGQEWESFTQCLIDLQAVETEKTIYVHEGVYDIFSEYRDAEVTRPDKDFPRSDTANYRPYSVLVPKNTTVIGLGDQGDVQLRYEPTPSQTYAAESWLVSPLNLADTATIKNVDVYCKNGRYTIHDETLGYEQHTEAVKTYENVRSYKLKNDSGLGFASGIGFGFDGGMTFNFTNCEFYNYNGGAPFYMHNRARSTAGRSYAGIVSYINVTDCIIDAGAANSTAITLGNTGANLHDVVTITDTQIRGVIKAGDESDKSIATYSNAYEFILDGCSEVTFAIATMDKSGNTHANPYEPVVTNQKEKWN